MHWPIRDPCGAGPLPLATLSSSHQFNMAAAVRLAMRLPVRAGS
eukprot:COSAG06_NODE_40244_length_403_cov_3.710526_1_plen_43_part_01